MGDYIKDVYMKIDGWYDPHKVSKIEEFDGGAGNVWQNLMNLNKYRGCVEWINIRSGYPSLQLTRLIFSGERPPVVFYNCVNEERFYLDNPESLSFEYCWPFDKMTNSGHCNIVIMSDYNKGTLKWLDSQEKITQKVPVVIYDSKYRSIPENFLNAGECNIWHATGKEFDLEYAQNFDYVLWTDGAKPVKIWVKALQGGLQTLEPPLDQYYLEFQVPQDTKVVDTCGAGDTFVAAVATYLATLDLSLLTTNDIKIATQFGIAAAQTVITQPYTAVTNINLQEWIKQNVHQ